MIAVFKFATFIYNLYLHRVTELTIYMPYKVVGSTTILLSLFKAKTENLLKNGGWATE